jgi:hypothetical protein
VSEGSFVPAGVLLALRMVVWRLALPVLRRVVRLERLVPLLSAARDAPRDLRRERLAERAVARLWRHSEGPCLERSLALYRVLGRLGADPTLVVAVGRSEAGILGHVWVKADGVARLETSDPTGRWQPIAAFDARGRLLSSA